MPSPSDFIHCTVDLALCPANARHFLTPPGSVGVFGIPRSNAQVQPFPPPRPFEPPSSRRPRRLFPWVTSSPPGRKAPRAEHKSAGFPLEKQIINLLRMPEVSYSRPARAAPLGSQEGF